MIRAIKLIIVVFLGSFLLGSYAYAQEALPKPIGKVVWVKGKLVATMPNKEERSLQKGSVIYLKDTLATDTSSQAQIVFTDNTLLTFKPATKFVLDQYEYQPGTKKKSVGKYVMSLLEGGFRTITGLIAKKNPKDYQINTPVATIGVRGTDFAVVLKNGELMMAYYKGSPCMSAKDETLCLSADVPYGAVPPSGSPIPLNQRPAVFDIQDPIVQAQMEGFGGSSNSSSSGNTNPRSSRPASGVFSSFCITQ